MIPQRPHKHKRRRKSKLPTPEMITENRNAVFAYFPEFINNDYQFVNPDLLIGACPFCQSTKTFIVKNDTSALHPRAQWRCQHCQRHGNIGTISQDLAEFRKGAR